VLQAIGWTLVHFVWQGTAIAVITVWVLASLRRSTANVRYCIACLGLAVMAAVSLLTFAGQLGKDAVEYGAGAKSPGVAAEEVRFPSISVAAERSVARMNIEAWFPAAVGFWIAGVTLLSVRMMAAWLLIQRMRRSATIAAEELAEAARVVASRLGIVRPVQILQSVLVSVPTAVGAIRPAILWPASLASGLSPAQIEAVIAHELAHIRRFDYFVNLLQTGVETLLFYHPAVWLVSGRIRSEREHCCDDLAVSVCGDRLTYVSALASLEELRPDRPTLALAANGGSLIHRVQRLLDRSPAHDRRDPVWVLVAIATLVLMFAADRSVGTPAASPSSPAAVPAATAAAAVPPVRAVRVMPAAPAGARQNTTVERRRSWSSMGTGYEIRYQGKLTVTADERDFVGMSPDGYFHLTETRLFGTDRTIELRGHAAGAIERRYFVDGREQPWEPDGRAWLNDILPGIVRRSGFDAEGQVEKLLKQSGPAGVLAEINALSTDSVRALYFKEFFRQARPAGDLLSQALEQASAQISSSHELAELLIAVGTGNRLNAGDWEPYFDALESVTSSWEHRRVSSTLAEAALPVDALERLIRSAETIESNYESATALVHISDHNKLDPRLRDIYIEVANGISSKQERNRALGALAKGNAQ